MGLALMAEEPALVMTEAEARAIAEPAARLLAKTRWAKLFAKRLEQSSDLIGLLLAVGMYAARVSPVLMQRWGERGTAKEVASPGPRGGVAGAGVGGPSAGDPATRLAYTGWGVEPAEAGDGLDYRGGIQPLAE